MIPESYAGNMMLGIAMGDALGAGYEFKYKNIEDFKDPELIYKDHPHKGSKHRAGMYTDDTQMSLVVAKLLRKHGSFSKKSFADQFIKTYKNNPIDGYAGGFKDFLDSVDSGEEFLERIKPDSVKNGAAMRSVPIGILPRVEYVVEQATINAKITHDTQAGIASSISIALMSHYMFYHGRLLDIRREMGPYIASGMFDYLMRVEDMKKRDLDVLFWKGNTSGTPCDGMRTVGAVLYVLQNFHDPRSIVKASIELGGDTDSVASLALGLHMITGDIEELPKQWMHGLYNGFQGMNHLIVEGDLLHNRFRFDTSDNIYRP